MTTPVTTPMTMPMIRALAVAMADAGVALADGSRWSHAATFGTFRYRGEEVTLDEAKMRAFVATFAAGGYPQKVPVDYDHGSLRSDPSGQSPKAGDVLELRVVTAAEELPPGAAEQIQRAGRALTDPRNFGLWARWRPTPTAEQRVRAREYTEMSIAFADTLTNPRSGETQGPTLLSIALTNTPHLDEMVPIAASRSGGSPAEPGHQENRMNKLLTALTARFGKPVETEEQGIAELNRAIEERDGQIRTLTAKAGVTDQVMTELGVTDTTQVVGKVRELKSTAQKAEETAREAKKTALSAKVDGLLKKYEDRFVPAEKEGLTTLLTADVEAGRDTVEKMLAARPKLTMTRRASAADGGQNVSDDAKLDARVKEFMRDEKLAYDVALERAEAEMAAERRAAAAAR